MVCLVCFLWSTERKKNLLHHLYVTSNWGSLGIVTEISLLRLVSVLTVWLSFSIGANWLIQQWLMLNTLLTQAKSKTVRNSQSDVKSCLPAKCLNFSIPENFSFQTINIFCSSFKNIFLLGSRILDYTTFLFVQNPTDLFRIRLDSFICYKKFCCFFFNETRLWLKLILLWETLIERYPFHNLFFSSVLRNWSRRFLSKVQNKTQRT